MAAAASHALAGALAPQAAALPAARPLCAIFPLERCVPGEGGAAKPRRHARQDAPPARRALEDLGRAPPRVSPTSAARAPGVAPPLAALALVIGILLALKPKATSLGSGLRLLQHVLILRVNHLRAGENTVAARQQSANQSGGARRLRFRLLKRHGFWKGQTLKARYPRSAPPQKLDRSYCLLASCPCPS